MATDYERFHSSTKAKKDRAARNKARRKAIREGRVKKGDGKDVHHVKPLAKGGSRSTANTRVVSRSSNRSQGAHITAAKKRARRT